MLSKCFLAFRVILKFLEKATFSDYHLSIVISSPLALPCRNTTTVSSALVFEWSTLIAMAVYAIIAYGIVALFQLVKPTNPEEVEQTVDNQ